MNDDTRFWVAFVVSLFSCISCIVITVFVYSYCIKTSMADKGYEEVMVVGSNQSLYQKVR